MVQPAGIGCTVLCLVALAVVTPATARLLTDLGKPGDCSPSDSTAGQGTVAASPGGAVGAWKVPTNISDASGSNTKVSHAQSQRK